MTRWTELHHDARGRLVTTLRPDGPVLFQRWDARDMLVELTDALGVVTRREYGSLGELVREHVDPGGLDLVYTHDCDPAGREVQFVDPTGAITGTERDRLGRIRRVDLPGGVQVQHKYDQAGRLARTIGPDGTEQRFEYKAGRLHTLEILGDPTLKPVPKHTYTHDGLGRLVRAQAGDSDIRRRYDSLGRLRQEDNSGRLTELEIDDLARTTRLIYPDKRRELHRLDALGRVTQIELEAPGEAGLDGGPPGVLVEASYLGSGRLAVMRHASGAATHLTYDPLGRLARVSHTDAQGLPLGATDLRHDRSDHRRLLVRSGPDAQVRLHDFDAHARLAELRAGFAPPELGALDQAAQDAAIEAAELAAAGATFHQSWTLTGADTPTVITVTENNVQSLVQRDLGPHHQVLAVGGAPQPHDLAGRRTADPEHVFWYDALGRLVEVSAADNLAVLTTHTYDALGRLSVATGLGQPVRTLYFGPLALHEETAGGLALRQYTHHPHASGPVLATTALGLLELHPGAFGDLALVTNLLGEPLLRYDYAVFGAPIVRDGNAALELPADALGLRPRWGGMVYAPESGLYLAPARAYDPIAALYLTPDPALHVDSPSPYTYCAHNPVDRHDPGGELWGGLLFGAIGAAFNVIQTWRSDPDADAWDLLAAGTIGFGAGFAGATTFGWASAGITRGLLSVAGRSSVALGSKTSIALSVTSGIGAGAISGGLSGALAGTAGGSYEAARYGGDAWELIKTGALREGISGMAAGAVGGGLFQGALRAGVLPSGLWSRIHGGRIPPGRPWGGRAAQLGIRGVVSPYGLGSAVIGSASAATGAAVGELWEGGELSHARVGDASWRGALLGLAVTALHPTSYQYWRTRASVRAAAHLETAHKNASTHHQRNVAQYPELSVPQHRDNTALDKLNNLLTRANLHGPDSIFRTRLEHEQMHEQWRFGQRYGYTRWATHGPWTPPTDVSSPARTALPSNHQTKG